MEYIRFSEGLNKYRLIPFEDNIFSHIKNPKKDYYRSIYLYDQTQYETYRKNKTVSGITDVKTNILLWDLDSEDNVEQARKDAIELCSRLVSKGVSQDDIKICFSGRKGFSVEISTDKYFTVDEFRNITRAFASDLQTFDQVVSDPNRLIRIPGTLHVKSGLYKKPLTLEELSNNDIEAIKEYAQTIEDETKERLGIFWNKVTLPDAIYDLRTTKVEKTEVRQTLERLYDIKDLNFKNKPRGFSNCKFAIMNGFFENGERNHCLTALAATCKAQGYPEEITYGILKSAARMQTQRTGSDPFPKEQIWNNIVKQVYGQHWRGGQYSCKTDNTIKTICDSLGHYKCKVKEDKTTLEIKDVFSTFQDFAKNIEKNTIKTGLPGIDERLRITTSMLVGLLGAPSSGKTSLLLNILNNTSKAGVNSYYLSWDMSAPHTIQKMLQKHTKRHGDSIIKDIAEGRIDEKLLLQTLEGEYKNVRLNFTSGQTIEEIKNNIIAYQDQSGEKIKLLAVDYLECIAGPYSDSTANSSFIANQLKDLSNELELCTLLLVQPQKHAGDASEPLLSMRNVKGSSTLEQAMAVLMSIYREGFSPQTPEDDRFLTVSILKNRMGEIFSEDFYWDGLRGEISLINDEGRTELDNVRERKKQKKTDDSSWG